MVKWKIHSHQKNISWNQCFTNLFTITLLSRMFCKKSVIGNFLNFHTVDYDTFCLDLEISKEFWLIIVFHHCRICLITDSLCMYFLQHLFLHSVEITEISAHTFLTKLRESTVHDEEVTKELISRNIFSVRENFSFFHTVFCNPIENLWI